MKRRALGRSGISVSEIGFGAWGIGGASRGASSYGETDDATSRDALRFAYDSGVTFFDTSDLYGYGRSETLIGETLRDVREKIVIASKVGFLEHGGPQDFSVDHVRKSLEGSLRRLRTEYLDLYQLHSPPPELLRPDSDLFSTLGAFVREGKVRALGVSVRSPEDGLAAARLPELSAIQVNFNLVDQRAALNGLMDLCLERSIGIVVRTPLCFGFLTGRYDPTAQFDERDHRSQWPPAQRKRWAEAPRLFLEAFENRDGQTNAQLALRYCLSYEAVATVIPGVLDRGQVAENVRASDYGPLTTRERERLEAIYRDHIFFVGKR